MCCYMVIKKTQDHVSFVYFTFTSEPREKYHLLAIPYLVNIMLTRQNFALHTVPAYFFSIEYFR